MTFGLESISLLMSLPLLWCTSSAMFRFEKTNRGVWSES